MFFSFSVHNKWNLTVSFFILFSFSLGRRNTRYRVGEKTVSLDGFYAGRRVARRFILTIPRCRVHCYIVSLVNDISIVITIVMFEIASVALPRVLVRDNEVTEITNTDKRHVKFASHYVKPRSDSFFAVAGRVRRFSVR